MYLAKFLEMPPPDCRVSSGTWGLALSSDNLATTRTWVSVQAPASVSVRCTWPSGRSSLMRLHTLPVLMQFESLGAVCYPTIDVVCQWEYQ
jgi:hypothetical protein